MATGLAAGLAGRAVRVVEVGARDGLQNEAGPRIATAVKVRSPGRPAVRSGGGPVPGRSAAVCPPRGLDRCPD